MNNINVLTYNAHICKENNNITMKTRKNIAFRMNSKKKELELIEIQQGVCAFTNLIIFIFLSLNVCLYT